MTFSPSPSSTPDTVEALAQVKHRWSAKEEERKLEQGQTEKGIKNSTGAVREQWKYRLAVLKEKIAIAKQEK